MHDNIEQARQVDDEDATIQALRRIQHGCVDCGKVVTRGDIVDGSERKFATWLRNHECERCGVNNFLDMMDPQGYMDHRTDGWLESFSIDASNAAYKYSKQHDMSMKVAMLVLLNDAPYDRDGEQHRCDVCGVWSPRVRPEEDERTGDILLYLCDNFDQCTKRLE